MGGGGGGGGSSTAGCGGGGCGGSGGAGCGGGGCGGAGGAKTTLTAFERSILGTDGIVSGSKSSSAMIAACPAAERGSVAFKRGP